MYEFFAKNGAILDQSNKRIRLKGINYFGFETDISCPHGLWSVSLESLLDFIKVNNFNATRVPISLAAVLNMENLVPKGINTTANPNLQNAALTVAKLLDLFIHKCRARGLLVLLDMHTHIPGGCIEESWVSSQYQENTWISGLVKLASRYKNDENVFAIDVKNEPHGRTIWSDWAAGVERMAAAIHKVNPRLLIFAEGIENPLHPDQNGSFWGGNLSDVKRRPIKLTTPNKLVYSPHVYGPDVFLQPYFQSEEFPQNMPTIWEKQWAYLKSLNLGTLVVGEWGGQYRPGTLDEKWQNAFGEYLRKNEIDNFYWCLNPNSGDTKGLLLDDWITPHKSKLQLLSQVVPTPTHFFFSQSTSTQTKSIQSSSEQAEESTISNQHGTNCSFHVCDHL